MFDNCLCAWCKDLLLLKKHIHTINTCGINAVMLNIDKRDDILGILKLKICWLTTTWEKNYLKTIDHDLLISKLKNW